MNSNPVDPNRQRRRGRVHGIHVAIGVVIVIVGITAVGAFSTSNAGRTRNSAASNSLGVMYPYEPYPPSELPCVTLGEGCNQPIISPWDALKGLEAILAALKSIDPSASCRLSSVSGQQMVKCVTKGGTETIPIPNSPPSNPSEAKPGLKASVNNVITVPGSPVPAQALATITNTGTVVQAVNVEAGIRPTTCAVGNLPSIPGLEISPETTGPVPIEPGATLTLPLTVTADATVPEAIYAICVDAEATSTAGEATADTWGTATVEAPPLEINQDGMPNAQGHNMGGANDYSGSIVITNPSPAEPVDVTVTVQLAPVSVVALNSASMEDATCDVNALDDTVKCKVPKMDAKSQLTLTLDFQAPLWGAGLQSVVTVGAADMAGSVDTKRIPI